MNLTAERQTGSTTVNLSWADNSTNESGFEIQYSDDGGSTWNALTAAAAGSTSYNDTVPYLLTYDGNGATGGTEPAAAEYEAGATVRVPGNTGPLVRTGHLFQGWNSVDDGSGTGYAADDTFTMGTENVTLYAVWADLGMIMITVISSEKTVPGVSGVTCSLQGGTDNVTLTYPFAMSETEITQKQYTAVMGGGPSGNSWKSGYGLGDTYPAYYVTWYEAAEFCNKLSRAEGKTPAYYSDDNHTTVYTALNTDTIYWNKAANGYGLYDMSGNVREWCWSWLGSNYIGGMDPEGADASTPPRRSA